ncbi:MAG: phosphoribosyl-AMP cyclohydrolase [Chromatiales bacterium]|nr:phosphoribosyl-AMP cyclohydrolase [Chromatiales bacterium]
MTQPQWMSELRFDEHGLIPAIAQEVGTGRLLMVAWMDRTALEETVATGRAVYFSRSRQRLWRKGEESGHWQNVRAVRLDCDADVVLLEVEQLGGIACHTGRHSCFFRELRDGEWVEIDPVLKSPEEIYGKG